METNPWLEKLEGIKALIRQTVRPLLKGEDKCALIMYPNHWNAGDMAIWCGTLKLLKELRINASYCCSSRNYLKEDLERKVKKGPILICGGGNFGDVYQEEVNYRRKIFQDFPHRKVIQLPQSIWFRNSENIASLKSLIDKIDDFTLLVRDLDSLSKAQEYFKCKVLLCPDLAFALGDLSSLRTCPEVDIFWLRRRDTETQLPLKKLEIDHSLIVDDWLETGSEIRKWSLWDRKFLNLDKSINEKIDKGSLQAIRLSQLLMFYYQRLARLRVIRGCRFLSQGKVVISDRLHGHILSMLLGIPHIVMDNNYNKLKNFYDTWTNDCSHIYWTNDITAAKKIVNNLL